MNGNLTDWLKMIFVMPFTFIYHMISTLKWIDAHIVFKTFCLQQGFMLILMLSYIVSDKRQMLGIILFVASLFLSMIVEFIIVGAPTSSFDWKYIVTGKGFEEDDVVYDDEEYDTGYTAYEPVQQDDKEEEVTIEQEQEQSEETEVTKDNTLDIVQQMMAVEEDVESEVEQEVLTAQEETEDIFEDTDVDITLADLAEDTVEKSDARQVEDEIVDLTMVEDIEVNEQVLEDANRPQGEVMQDKLSSMTNVEKNEVSVGDDEDI